MKKNAVLVVLLAATTLAGTLVLKYKRSDTPWYDKLRSNARQHSEETEEEEKGERKMTDEKYSFIKARAQYEYDIRKDPGTGRIPAGIHDRELSLAKVLPAKEYAGQSGVQGTENLNNYIAAGPDSIGGRTRAVAYDKRYNGSSNQVIIAGSVSGGIFRSTNGGATWTRVNPENDIHNLTSIAQDPRAGFEDTWYAGGGEPIGNSASDDGAPYLGYGVWKSTNNGVSWTKLTLEYTDLDGTVFSGGSVENFDSPFDFVHRIAVNPVNGHVYVAGHRRLLRSTDGGNSWRVVFSGTRPAGSATGQMDVTCTSAGRIYLAVNGGFPDASRRGVWTSANGNINSWTRIAGGHTLGVDSAAGWRGNSYKIDGIDNQPFPPDTTFGSKRIILALAPSNQNILYVCYENGLSQDGSNPKPEADLFKLNVTGGSNVWTNLSANMPDFPGQMSGVDPLELQEGYNLTLAVKPDNPAIVFIGGTNLFRSTDGFSTSTQTAWIGGYRQDFSSGLQLYPGSHPDIHNLVFMPNNGGNNTGYKKALCANDGGIQTTLDITAAGGINPVDWNMIRNYQTLQYVHVGIDPKSGQNNFIGGAQDNGTQIRVDGDNNHIRIVSGDGGMAAIGPISGSSFILYASSQLGDIYRDSTNDFENIRPTGLTAFPGIPDGYGDFITYFKMDFDNPEDLYYANFNRLFRTTSASTVTASGWDELTGVAAKVNPGNPSSGTDVSIRAMDITRGPYAATHVMYIGTSNGKVFRLDDPENAAENASPVDITPPDLETFRTNGTPVNISDISINPNNDNEILVVVSNYSVTVSGSPVTDFNIWWTNNAKSTNPTWRNAEGNLTLPSIRSCQIVVKKEGNTSVTEYYVGTSVGLYSAVNIGSILQGGGSVTWEREGGNILNYSLVSSLDYRPSDNVLLLGTHGNGLYYAEIGNPDYHPNASTPVNEPDRNDKNFINITYPSIVDNHINYQIGNMYSIRNIVLTVTNTQGQTVLRKTAAYANGELKLPSLARGIYILTITSEDYTQQYVRKFVKK